MTAEHDPILFLQRSPFFRSVPIPVLKELVLKCDCIRIASGQLLFSEGDEGDSLYVVIYGRLRALQTKGFAEESTIAEITSGELIGELALLTDEPRQASIIAIRDSKLLRLSKDTFVQFITSNPLLMFPIVKSSMLRLLKTKQNVLPSTDIMVIAPAGKGNAYINFARHLTQGLDHTASTLHLNHKNVLEVLGDYGIDKAALDDDDHEKLSDAFNALETKYRYIICETDKEYTAWTRRCLRQASTIFLVSDFSDDETLNPIEEAIFAQPARIRKTTQLILLHETSQHPTGTARWLLHRHIQAHHHMRAHSKDDFRRFVAIIRGRSISLVLGGGGARALAHVGVYKALTQLKIPIDLVCGSSFGALVGALIAMNLSIDEMIEHFQKELVHNKHLFNYTFPFVSLLSGKSWGVGFDNVFGNTQIEDLWKRYFCVTSNVSKSQSENRTRGSLSRAIRASVSLPGIVPPISNEEDDLFLDGSVLNNLPVDVMRQFAGSGQIIAVQPSPSVVLKAHIPDGYVSGWRLLYMRYFKSRSNTMIPSIAEIILKSIMLAGEGQEKLMCDHADFLINIDTKHIGLFDFHQIDKLIEMGYSTTMNQLSMMENLVLS